MKRRILALSALIVVVLATSVQAVQPRYISPTLTLTFNGTTAHCFASCIGNNDNDDIELTLTLYQGTTYVDSWSNSGKGRVTISEDSKAQKGKTYKLVLSCSVNGTSQPSTSTTKTFR